MKSTILHEIYRVFAAWSRHFPAVCDLGCSACCTRNVTITAIEGEEILRFINSEKLSLQFGKKLSEPRLHQPPAMTTNDFATACLEGRDVDPGENRNTAPCPFLFADACLIYPARPFGCRVFASSKRCSATQPALVPDYYFEAATAVTQLLEHLGQREYWGNMLDVIPALLDISTYREIAEHLDQTLIIKARLRTLRAQPLPGFLLSEDNADRVTQLLESIFSTQVDGKRIEDILNGR
jgi:hypothetical protein